MKTYKIVVTELAEQDVESVNDYIAYVLHSPENAAETVSGIRKAIATLRQMPKRHELHEDEALRVKGIRKQYYKNYKILYFISEEVGTIYVIRVFHMLVDSTMRLYETLKLD